MFLSGLLLSSCLAQQASPVQFVVLSGPSEHIPYNVMMKATVEPLTPGTSREVPGGDIIIKLANGTFGYVSKSVPTLREVRGRKFLYDLVYKHGLQKSISFSEVEQSEFKNILEPFWQRNIHYGPAPDSKFKLNASLATTVRVGSSVKIVNFSPRQSSAGQVTTDLKNYPIQYIRNDEEVQQYRRDHPFYGDMPFLISIAFPINHDVETELVKNTLDLLRAYARDRIQQLDSQFDRYISKVPELTEMVSRRSCRTIDDLRQTSPKSMEILTSVLQNTQGEQLPSTNFGAASLTHRYDIQLQCYNSRGSFVVMSLTELL